MSNDFEQAWRTQAPPQENPEAAVQAVLNRAHRDRLRGLIVVTGCLTFTLGSGFWLLMTAAGRDEFAWGEAAPLIAGQVLALVVLLYLLRRVFSGAQRIRTATQAVSDATFVALADVRSQIAEKQLVLQAGAAVLVLAGVGIGLAWNAGKMDAGDVASMMILFLPVLLINGLLVWRGIQKKKPQVEWLEKVARQLQA